MGTTCRSRRLIAVFILGVLEFLVQAEAESELAFVADRQIREDEVAGGTGTVQQYHAGYWGASEHSQLSLVLGHAATRCDIAGLLERSE